MSELIGFIGFWGALALSYHFNHSWGYAIVHGILGWVYIAVKCCMVFL